MWDILYCRVCIGLDSDSSISWQNFDVPVKFSSFEEKQEEKLSIGLRYFHEKNNKVQEVFVGFVELKGLDAKSIAQTIDEFLTKEELIPVKCVGLGFDGCSTMSGKESGVQAILRKKYTKALFFHCSSHKLNLVINDLNALPEIRNTIGTTKDIISFFRESILRRKLIPNISTLCETRWSEKHKTIRVFKDNFHVIMEALETLSRDGNSATRNHAFQLRAAASRVSFILCLLLIAKYSVLMEPVVNVLQSVTLDAIKASQHIKNIMQLLKRHRDDADKVTDEILRDAFVIAKTLGLEEDMTSVPRIFGRQSYRSNHPARSPSEYWKRSLIIPYLDIINSLKGRFVKENTPSFALSKLHPAQMQTMSMEKRSFSSLRRMKTWLRSTMVESRLNGLAMMSVHRKIINENIKDFNNKVVEKFTKNPRRLCFN
ncbi:zinc finger MYM-type protein 1-like [Centruroides vittatus]|uniref:zinc finger MYM-type protein 1-like n=1 Tax=Centruroides vittatus TaxID=120091 RepID=UPI00350F8B6F